MKFSRSFFALALLVVLTADVAFAAKSCEVCTKVLQKVVDRVKDSGKIFTPEAIENQFISYCKSTEVSVESRFCYYLGGAEDSATKILSKMSKPLSWSKPVDKVCEDLRKMDEQICDLRYEVQVDISNVDLRTLRVRELRKILSSWNQKCDGCIEKEEFIQRIEELKPKYAPEATAAKEEL